MGSESRGSCKLLVTLNITRLLRTLLLFLSCRTNFVDDLPCVQRAETMMVKERKRVQLKTHCWPQLNKGSSKLSKLFVLCAVTRQRERERVRESMEKREEGKKKYDRERERERERESQWRHFIYVGRGMDES